MDRVFGVECRSCHGNFYCNYNELRHAGVQLICPYCRERFLPEEAASLDERWQPHEGLFTLYEK